MKIFLTGGTGFIGSYVVKELSDAGHSLTILARNPDKVPLMHTLPGVTIVSGSLNDYEVIVKNMVGHDACIHIALGWGDDGLNMLKNDTLSSVYFFEAAAKLHYKQFIYTSSTAAIGELTGAINETTITRPIDYYGATKAASENYLLAVSHNYDMRCNIIRPGYTFGNPVIEGAPTQPDKRFRSIVEHAKNNQDIHVIKHDGTQFIWAGNLAKIYRAILDSSFDRRIFFGLGNSFFTWEAIAQEAVKLCSSSSHIIVDDKGYSENHALFDVSPILKEFGYKFKEWSQIRKHLTYLVGII